MADRCGVCAEPEREAIRFHLLRALVVEGKRTTRGCGRLFLCQRCWKELVRGSRRRGGSPPK